jgi:RimJ/RimL family protein N-acetyltransferase
MRPARPEDLGYIFRLEHDPANAPFITPWTRRMHQKAMGDRDALQLILESRDPRRRVGFVLLRGLKDGDGTIEVKRIVVESKGAGFGRAAVRLIKKLAFGRLRAHRLWLDVKDFNHRAKRLYASEGFVKEGTLRECIKRKGRYYSLIVMSVLRREYRK